MSIVAHTSNSSVVVFECEGAFLSSDGLRLGIRAWDTQQSLKFPKPVALKFIVL